MGDISVRSRAIYVEIEAAPGTPETLVGADVVQVQNLKFNPIENLEFQEREIIRSSLNPAQGVYTGALMGFTFDVELKGSGTAGTPPRYGDLLRACGMQETIVASTSVTYRPQSDLTAHGAVTIGYREGGNYRIATACRGTFSINMTARKTALISFSMKGKISSETVAAAPTPTEETTIPRAFLGATFQIGGFAAPIEALTLDVGNTVAVSPNPNNADGFGAIRITGRNSRGTVNPEVELISAKDYIGLLRAGTTQAIQTGVIGSVAGNRWALSMPAAYFREISDEEREALLTYGVGFGCAESTGDDEFSLQLT